MLVVFDLDGVLADCTHRLPHIQKQPKDWDAFFAACKDDEVIEAGQMILYALGENAGCEIEIWTGRPMTTFEATRNWLHKHLLAGHLLTRMRDPNDRRPDHILKEEWLHECRRYPDLVFEDRQRVVDMWRRNGVPVYQTAAGDF